MNLPAFYVLDEKLKGVWEDSCSTKLKRIRNQRLTCQVSEVFFRINRVMNISDLPKTIVLHSVRSLSIVGAEEKRVTSS